MRKSPARYKHEFDLRNRKTPHLTRTTYVFLDSPPLRANSDSAAESLSKKAYDKLHSRALGSSRIIGVHENTFPGDENSILNSVFIDRLTHALRAVLLSRKKNKSPLTPQRQRKDEQDSTNNEHAVERILKHIGKGRDSKYIVRKDGYSAKDDTVEFVDHFSKHFTKPY